MGKILVLIAVVLLIIFGVWFFFFKGEATEKVTKSGPIIFFGDSLTAGVGADPGEDFPSVVTEKLNLKNAVNAGVSGDTTESALQRLKTDVLDKNPSLVVVELSGNDFLQQKPSEETFTNLDSIVGQIKETGASVLLVHIRFPLKTKSYEDGFKKIAKKYNVAVVWNSLDRVTGDPKLMSDSIHPNTFGYKIMAERISKSLKKLL